MKDIKRKFIEKMNITTVKDIRENNNVNNKLIVANKR